jgi:hypothetical protein
MELSSLPEIIITRKPLAKFRENQRELFAFNLTDFNADS